MAQPLMAEESYLRRAENAFNQKNYQHARLLIDKYIATNADDPYGHEAKAMILDKLGFYTQALDELKETLTLSPKNHRAAESYGGILQKVVYNLSKLGKYDYCIDRCEYYNSFLPKYAAIRIGRAASAYACGVAYFERWCKNGDDADYLKFREYMNQARDLDATASTGELIVGISAYNDGDYKRALSQFQVAKTLRPKNPTVALWNGLAYAALGSNELALKELKTAQEVFGNNPCLRASIADVYRNMGQFEDAKLEYLTALSLKPDDGRLYNALNDLFMTTGAVDEGIQLYQQALQDGPNFRVAYHLGLLLHQMGRYQEANSVFTQAENMATSPLEKAKTHVERALIAFDQDPEQSGVLLTPNEAKVLADADDPLFHVYQSYVIDNDGQRETSARRALKNESYDARWAHAQAFLSLARLKANSKQPLWAMECVRQSWMRTPQGSAALPVLQNLFAEYKDDALNTLDKELARNTQKNKDPQRAQEAEVKLRAQVQAVGGAQLGDPGVLIIPPMEMGNANRIIVPAETEPSLNNLAGAFAERVRWMGHKD